MKIIATGALTSKTFISILIPFAFLSCNQPVATQTTNRLSTSAKQESGADIHLPKVNGATRTWWKDVEKDIETQEYNVTWEKDQKVFESPNRANNLRARYAPGHLQLSDKATSDWHVDF